MDGSSKRKAADTLESTRTKTKKQWRVPRKNDHGAAVQQAQSIQPGDSGIWVTCAKGKEGKCVGEIRDLFSEYAELLYPPPTSTSDDHSDAAAGADIENEIQAEIDGLRKPSEAAQLFTAVRLNVPCVTFIKTVAPVEPVALVKRICEDAMQDSSRKRTRSAKRLSPMELMGRASAEGLEKVALEVLRPHFHQEPARKRKFAIRPTLRNHNTLTRDSIIKQVASLVGSGHEVDLKNYELLIVVEVYQNVCGVSVVDDSFERLKRYNVSEIYDPTPKDVVQAVNPNNEDSASRQDAAVPPETPATSTSAS